MRLCRTLSVCLPKMGCPRSTKLYHERETILAELGRARSAFKVILLHTTILQP